jgi:hypothetical protein
LFFTYFLFTLWTVVAGVTVLASGRRASRVGEPEPLLA